MAGSDQRWIDIATNFPAGLDTDTDASKLPPDKTPDAYNMDIDRPGILASLPAGMSAGTALTANTHTIGAATYTWFYGRCWLISSNYLYYLAPGYQDTVIYQDIGRLLFAEDTNAMLTFFPFAGSSMFAAKSTGGYAIPQALSPRGNFVHGDIEPSMKIANATDAAPLDGIAYASNEYGLFAWDGNTVQDITENVGSQVGTTKSPNYFAERRVRLDYQSRRVVLSSAADSDVAVFDPASKKLFVYTTPTTAFRYTTRTLMDARTRPFTIRKIALYFENTTGNNTTITYQVRLDDEDWRPEESFVIADTEAGRVRREQMLDTPIQARRFALRLTSLPVNIRISRISVSSEDISAEEGWSQ